MPLKAQEWVIDNFMDIEYREAHHINEGINVLSYLQEKGYSNFLYDKTTGLILCNLPIGHHQMAMTKLYAFHKAMETKGNDIDILNVFDSEDTDKLADRFVEECYGFFESSVSRHDCITISENYKLSFQEKKCFAGYKFNKI